MFKTIFQVSTREVQTREGLIMLLQLLPSIADLFVTSPFVKYVIVFVLIFLRSRLLKRTTSRKSSMRKLLLLLWRFSLRRLTLSRLSIDVDWQTWNCEIFTWPLLSSERLWIMLLKVGSARAFRIEAPFWPRTYFFSDSPHSQSDPKIIELATELVKVTEATNAAANAEDEAIPSQE